MDNKKSINNVILVIISNIIKLFSGILVAFYIPKVLSIEDYGYYRIFVLYLTYMGLFNFGFIDGIYLRFGGHNFSSIDSIKFRAYFRFLILIVFCISIIIALFSLITADNNLRIVIILLAANLLSVHITGYFQIVSQITSRFREYSQRTIIIAVGNLIALLIMYIFNIKDFALFTIFLVVFNYVMSLWYIFTYKSIVFGQSERIINLRQEIWSIMKIGFPLLLSNIFALIALSLDKQVVSIFFSVGDFAVYSFAYSMLSMITVVISAIGVVLYPYLKRTDPQNMVLNYGKLNALIISIVYFGLLGYFPLSYFIPRFLPQYVDSVQLFRIALPGLLLISSITAIKHNFFKISFRNKEFLIISFSIIIIIFLLNWTAYSMYGTMTSIAFSSIIGYFIWYVFTDGYLVLLYKVKWKKNLLFVLIGLILFYISTEIENIILSSIVYFIGTIVTVFVFNLKYIRSSLSILGILGRDKKS